MIDAPRAAADRRPPSPGGVEGKFSMLKPLTAAAALASLTLLAACGEDGADKTGAAAPAAAAAAAAAPDPEAQALTERLLQEAAVQMARENFTPAEGVADQHREIAQDGSHEWTLNLRGGQTYRIVGVCNIGCENLDLELRDGAGTVVTSDVLEDDVPIVEIAPAADGAYRARLIMKDCADGPCLASARLFQRG